MHNPYQNKGLGFPKMNPGRLAFMTDYFRNLLTANKKDFMKHLEFFPRWRF